jgi:hypothetical protein
MPKYTVQLPVLHDDQVRAFYVRQDERGGEWDQNAGGRFMAGRCGRRWGKTVYGETWICDAAIKGFPTGWFAPDYKTLSETYNEILDILEPVVKSSSKNDGVIRLKTGGRIDFWTLENERAGRSRKYKRSVVDEAAFTKSNMLDVWERSIKPTLLDMQGSALVISNTNGVDPENFFWQICNEPKHGFTTFHAPSWANPTIPSRLRDPLTGVLESQESWEARRDEIFADLRRREHPLVFAQEYAAEFVDWSGVAFFDLEKLLVNGQPIPFPRNCDAVFAVIDTATKTGTANDGTGVTYWARSRHGSFPLILLDYDLQQIEGALLETWLPTVFQNLQSLAQQCGARAGSIGAWIEDKNSGMVLIQQSNRRSLPVHAIDSKLTSLGKDERAMSVSGYHYRGEVKISEHAYNKTFIYKGTTRNHLISQVTGFRIGDKDAAKRADDLLDCYTYGIAIALGDSGGF